MTDPSSAAATAHVQDWGHLPGGRPVHLYTLHNGRGLSVQLSDYGARIVRVRTPDRSGHLGDVTLGHDSLAPYLDRAQAPYFGAVVGRFANRVAAGHFRLDGREYRLGLNDGPNALHGGASGFDARLWTARLDGGALELSLISADGDEGYPGRLEVRVRYSLSAADELSIEYRASSDAPTHLNLTNHAYWNLQGGGAGDVLGHELSIAADAYTPVDATLIPTGELAAVDGTPFDFRAAHPIGERIGSSDPQLRRAGGYDHNFVLSGGVTAQPRHVATLYDPASGRQMEVQTTEPGLQFYSGNFLDGSIVGRGGSMYRRNSALCLETQHFPDSPNRPEFPGTVLRPGEIFASRTVYRFSVRE
ncbi:aldose epimerase family protein [Deinococcus sp.]|uniref:aldose epimerase family protein n=1 Tax=Deinococcus sp. TaxID=47478 RepID=UPI003CC6A893